MRKQIMTYAWVLFKHTKTTFTSFGAALKAAWKTYKAKAAMKAGRVILTFSKSSGEITTRTAEMWHGDVTGNGYSNPLTVLFSDLTKGGATSCFRADRLIGFKAA